jgi:hypothetical protein
VENPVSKVPRAAYQKPPPDPFSRDEAEAIIADMLAHYPGQVHNLVEWWFFSGPRTSEAFGLQWPKVDLRSAYFTVDEAVVRGERKGTKTSTVRDVTLNSRALAALQRQKAHTLLAGTDVWQDPRYGVAWVDERAFRRSFWIPCLKRLGIRYRRPYNMRHTYATMMLMAGLTPAYCARQLGHSVEMFLRTYSRWLDGSQNASSDERRLLRRRAVADAVEPVAHLGDRQRAGGRSRRRSAAQHDRDRLARAVAASCAHLSLAARWFQLSTDDAVDVLAHRAVVDVADVDVVELGLAEVLAEVGRHHAGRRAGLHLSLWWVITSVLPMR